MGFSGIASHLIMFIAVLTASVALIFLFNTQISESSSSISIKQEYLSNQIKTAVVIESANYFAGDTTFYIRNVGETKLYANDTMVYIDGERINYSDLDIRIESDTDLINVGVWDKGEIVRIVATKNLAASETHQIVIVTQYNGRDVLEFSY